MWRTLWSGASQFSTLLSRYSNRVHNNNVIYSMVYTVHCGRIMYTLALLDHALNI